MHICLTLPKPAVLIAVAVVAYALGKSEAQPKPANG